IECANRRVDWPRLQRAFPSAATGQGIERWFPCDRVCRCPGTEREKITERREHCRAWTNAANEAQQEPANPIRRLPVLAVKPASRSILRIAQHENFPAGRQ